MMHDKKPVRRPSSSWPMTIEELNGKPKEIDSNSQTNLMPKPSLNNQWPMGLPVIKPEERK
jgi:hypothetical protein